MNDTIELHSRHQEILNILVFADTSLSSSDIHERLHSQSSLVTIKRDLAELFSRNYIHKEGRGAHTQYFISECGRIHTVIDVHAYVNNEKRAHTCQYNFDFFDMYPATIFSQNEKRALDSAQEKYRNNIKSMSDSLHKKELERFVIELSWKSSRIEGNTYTLLDTEKLIRDGISSSKNTEDETKMILNHKKAFDYIFKHHGDFAKKLTQKNIEHIHGILMEGLGITSNPRRGRVGITGSYYITLGIDTQIIEAVETLCKKINTLETPYDKAVLALSGLSYIQVFEDGNKRIARFIANALLLAYTCAPLSYRTVDEEYYREAMLVFYETQSMVAIKEMFIEQSLFAAQHYSV